MRIFTTSAAAVALMAVSPAFAQQQQQPVPQTQQQPQMQQQAQLGPQDQQFAMQAATSGLLEVRLGEIAQQKAQNDQVRAFGQRILEEHGAANEKLMAILQEAGIQPPQQPPPQHLQMVQQFQQMQGEQFDRAYISTIMQEHQNNIQLYRQEAEQGQHEELTAFAEETLPALEEHLQQAQDIGRDIGVEAMAQAQPTQPQQPQQQPEQQAEAEGAQITVEQAAPAVGVQQPGAEVTVVDPEPQVQVETPEPQVTVQQPEPDVEIQQAEPQVEVDTAEPEVTVVEPEAQEPQAGTAEMAQQAEVPPPQPADQMETEAQVTPEPAEPAEPAVTEEEVAAEETAMPTGDLQELVGMEVYGQNDEQVGEVSDLVMSADGQVEQVVIDQGGFLGIGAKSVAVDISDIEVAEDRVRVNMTDEQIAELPEFEAAE